jgi:hypothetical protein
MIHYQQQSKGGDSYLGKGPLVRGLFSFYVTEMFDARWSSGSSSGSYP